MKKKKGNSSLLTVLKEATASERTGSKDSLLTVLRRRTRERKTVKNREGLLKSLRPQSERKS